MNGGGSSCISGEGSAQYYEDDYVEVVEADDQKSLANDGGLQEQPPSEAATSSTRTYLEEIASLTHELGQLTDRANNSEKGDKKIQNSAGLSNISKNGLRG